MSDVVDKPPETEEGAVEEPEPEEEKGFQFPSVYTILALVTVLVWVGVIFIPSGQYELDENGSPIPGTYEQTGSPLDFGERAKDLFLSPSNGLYGVQDPESGFIGPNEAGFLFGAAGVFLFILAIGVFMTTVFATGAMDRGIAHLAYGLRDRGWLVIVAIMGLFAVLSSTMGFAEETLGFYALTVPLCLALGFDRITAFAMTFLGASAGLMGSTVNPFSMGVASEEAGVSIGDGIGRRFDRRRHRPAARAAGSAGSDRHRVHGPLRAQGAREPRDLGRRLYR